MSDDFGGVSARGGGGRELEILRKQYRDHRNALARMASEAPTELLAGEYTRLIREIDSSLAKLTEIAGGPARATIPARPVANAVNAPNDQTAGARSLVTNPETQTPADGEPQFTPPDTPERSSGGRFGMIIAAGLVVIALIGWLVWRASRDRASSESADSSVVTETTAPATTPATSPATSPARRVPAVVTPPPLAPAAGTSALTIDPASADYGAIRKGTRAVRQFEFTNTGTQAMQFQVARSQCRCLYYEYKGKLDPKKHETITVTVDGARAKAGTLHERVEISSKTDPNVTGSFEVNATIK